MALDTAPQVSSTDPCAPASDFTVRPWRPGDTPALNALYNDPAARPAARKLAPRSDAQWQWEFAARGGQPRYVVARSAGRVVGTQGFIPIELVIDGRVAPSAKDEDTLVHQAWRGRGVLDAMYRALLQDSSADGFCCAWGFTTSAVRALLRNGFQVAGSFHSWLLDAAPAPQSGTLQRWIDGIRGRTHGEPPRGRAPAGLVIHELSQPDPRSDEFSLAFARRVGGVNLHLSAGFLRWRVFENPFRPHRLLAASVGERLAGLCVIKLDADAGRGYISDLAALGDDDDAQSAIAAELLRAALERLKSDGAQTIEARPAGGHPYNVRLRRLLAGAGFHRSPRQSAATFLVRPIAGDAAVLCDPMRWRLCELMREY